MNVREVIYLAVMPEDLQIVLHQSLGMDWPLAVVKFL
jgi:hypothetical protein